MSGKVYCALLCIEEAMYKTFCVLSNFQRADVLYIFLMYIMVMQHKVQLSNGRKAINTLLS